MNALQLGGALAKRLGRGIGRRARSGEFAQGPQRARDVVQLARLGAVNGNAESGDALDLAAAALSMMAVNILRMVPL